MEQGIAVQLAIGVAVAAVAAFWLARMLRRLKRRDEHVAAHTTSPALRAVTPPVSSEASPSTAARLNGAQESAAVASPDVPTPSRGEPEPDVSDPPPQQQSASLPAPSSYDAEISASEQRGEKAELAYLYIKQAAAYVAAGAREDAASRLRDAIRVAALNRLAAPHALARIELGELFLGNGDPITACEQWQIARNLFHDLGQPRERDDVDKRMLSNGCPTDWVLTDF